MRTPSRGFTLIEILVVLLIAGLTASLAAVSLSQDSRTWRWNRAVDQFADVLSLAVEETEYAGANWRLIMARPGAQDGWEYQWQHEVNGQWQNLQGDDWVATIFSHKRLPADLHVELKLTETFGLKKASLVDEPPVYFMANGELTPFEITITDTLGRDYRRTIRGDLVGNIQIDSLNTLPQRRPAG